MTTPARPADGAEARARGAEAPRRDPAHGAEAAARDPEDAVGGTRGSGSCEPDDHGPGRCVVCTDEGRVGRVVEIVDGRSARVRFDDGDEVVALDLVEGAEIGTDLVVHGGFAIGWLAGAQDDAGNAGAVGHVGEPGPAGEVDRTGGVAAAGERGLTGEVGVRRASRG